MSLKYAKYLCSELILLLGVLAIIANIIVNYWERIHFQNELLDIRRSIYNLKQTIHNLEEIYESYPIESPIDTEQGIPILDRRIIHDLKIKDSLSPRAARRATHIAKKQKKYRRHRNAVTIVRFPKSPEGTKPQIVHYDKYGNVLENRSYQTWRLDTN